MNNPLSLLKCLGEETRYRIIEALLFQERCACELPDIIKRTQSNTSMHLAKLLEADIIKQRREGKRIYYSIQDERVRKIIKIAKGETTMKNTMMEPRENKMTKKDDPKKSEDRDSCDCGGCC